MTADTVAEAKYSADQLRDMLAKGHAIKNDKGEPSYPIGDTEDLDKAIPAVGRGGAGHDKIRAYIIKRAKALGASDKIPDAWSKSGASKGAKESFTESLTLAEAVRGQQPIGRRQRIKLIDAGWGSSGYYSPAVLAEAAKNGVFPVGTQMFLDHPSRTESADRPERSVKDLAAVFTTPAQYADNALWAETRVFAPFQQLLAEQADAIGVSIRAAGIAEPGEAEGRQGMVITALTEGLSVDFVTRAGRGGQIMQLLESARAELREGRNVGAWLESRIHLMFTQFADNMYGCGQLTREERIALSSAIGDALTAFTAGVERDAPQLYNRDLWDDPDAAATVAESGLILREGHGMTANDLGSAICKAVREAYGGPKRFAWVRDYTDDWVVYTVETDKDTALFQQPYTVDERTSAVTLAGTRAEVNARTTYVPVGAPPPGQPPLDERKHMSGTTGAPNGGATDITEADRLRSENTELKSRLAEAELKAAQLGDNARELEETKRSLDEAGRENLRLRANDAARAKAVEALTSSTLPETAHERVIGAVTGDHVPLNAEGALDEAKLVEAIKAAIETERRYLARFAEEAGLGAVRGLGTSGNPNELSESDLEQGLNDVFTSIGLPAEQATLAAKGR